jgi:hypothetical protein
MMLDSLPVFQLTVQAFLHETVLKCDRWLVTAAIRVLDLYLFGNLDYKF